MKWILTVLPLAFLACRPGSPSLLPKALAQAPAPPAGGPYVTLGHSPDSDFGPHTPNTRTSGFQEAVGFSLSHGFDLYVCGGAGGPVYNIATTIRIPPCQDWKIDGGVYVLNWVGPPNESLLEFDSAMNLECKLGMLVYGGNMQALAINPRNPVPIDGFPVFTESKIECSGVSGYGRGVGVWIWGRNAPVVYNKFLFYGILDYAENLYMIGTVRANEIEVMHLHTRFPGRLLYGGEGVQINWGRVVTGKDGNPSPLAWCQWVHGNNSVVEVRR